MRICAIIKHHLILSYLNFDCYISSLEELIAKNQLDTRGNSDASGLLNGLMKFEFLFLLYFWFDTLVITKPATDKVQGACLNIAVSCHLVKSCVQQFMIMRSNDDHFEATLRKTKERCSSLGEFETGRIRTRRAPFDENSDGDVYDPTTDAKEKFKIDVYYVFWMLS